MNWEAIKPWVAKIAPMLGTALGGPLGGAAGALLGSALGIKDATPGSIEAAIKTGTLTGDQIVALKKAEEDFALKMADLGYENTEALAELEFKDRDSARNREIQIRDKMPMILGLTFTVGFFFILVWMLKWGIQREAGGDALLILLGALGAGVTQVLNYYFGSSRGSQEKNTLLHRSTPT